MKMDIPVFTPLTNKVTFGDEPKTIEQIMEENKPKTKYVTVTLTTEEAAKLFEEIVNDKIL